MWGRRRMKAREHEGVGTEVHACIGSAAADARS